MNMMDDVYIRMVCVKHAFKEKAKEILWNEEGGFGTIEAIILIAIVLVIGALFWDEITGFVTDLMKNVFGDGRADDFGKKVDDGMKPTK